MRTLLVLMFALVLIPSQQSAPANRQDPLPLTETESPTPTLTQTLIAITPPPGATPVEWVTPARPTTDMIVYLSFVLVDRTAIHAITTGGPVHGGGDATIREKRDVIGS